MAVAGNPRWRNQSLGRAGIDQRIRPRVVGVEEGFPVDFIIDDDGSVVRRRWCHLAGIRVGEVDAGDAVDAAVVFRVVVAGSEAAALLIGPDR